jgi:hypothetical protein
VNRAQLARALASRNFGGELLLEIRGLGFLTTVSCVGVVGEAISTSFARRPESGDRVVIP